LCTGDSGLEVEKKGGMVVRGEELMSAGGRERWKKEKGRRGAREGKPREL